ncbi:MAG: hypothetical protein JW798_08560 [Prolixibacteraceae bacterium]|nr:hypothetical protein [Prolixibacteraceae bacterium]
MDTIKIKIDGKQNMSFFINLIEKFKFIKEYTVISDKNQKIDNVHIPIEWAKEKPSIDDFAGIWQNNPITIEEIRKKGWKRN